jgi:peptidoglycan-associated lipoprotein
MDPSGSMAGSASGRMGGSGSTYRPALDGFKPAPELADIYFEFDKADVREADITRLDAHAGWLKSNTNQLVMIEGHCDERGTTAYNTALGDRRARATKNYLVSRGVPAARISVISYGEERPMCSQQDAECWAKNRRAHFLVKSR